MKCFFLPYLLALFALAAAFERPDKRDGTTATTTSSPSVSPTSVYVTITTGGVLATVLTVYLQLFMSTYSATVSDIQAGSVGMGSLTGSVGGVRLYSQTTISNEGAALGVAGGLGMFAFVAGILL